MTLSWDPGPDPAIVAYIIEYIGYPDRRDGAGDEEWQMVRVTGAHHTLTGLENRRAYRFRVREVRSAGMGDPSPSQVAIPAPEPPAWPTLLAAQYDNGRVMLTWRAPGPGWDGGRPIMHYEYEIDVDCVGGRWKTTGSDETHYTVPNLTSDRTYWFRVQAVNAVGASRPSDYVKVGSGCDVVHPPPVVDPEVPVMVSFGSASYPVNEGGAVPIVVRLSRAPGRTVVITVTATNHLGGATTGDYSGVPASVTFASGETARSFSFEATADTVNDPGEGVELGFMNLSSSGVEAGGPAATTVSITDAGSVDTEVPVTVSFGGETYSAAEGGTTQVAVRLSEDPRRTVVVPITVTDLGGATAGDYMGVPASVTFQSGETEREFTFRAAVDADDDAGEGVELGFVNLPSGVTPGATNSVATVSIINVGEVPVSTDTTTGLPRSFNAYWPTQTSITLGWFSVETAGEYKLEYRKEGESNWTPIPGEFDHLPSTSDNRNLYGVAAGLECETGYEFQLSFKGSGEARGDGGRYPYETFSDPVMATERTGECAREEQVTNLLVSIEKVCATLTWTPPAGARATGYRVVRQTRAAGANQMSEPVTLVEEPNRVANTYRDCTAEYPTEGAEHVYRVSALDNDPGPDEEAEFGQVSTSLEYYGPSQEAEEPRDVRFILNTRAIRELAWEAPPERRLTTVKMARAGGGPQQLVIDPWITGYRVERLQYRDLGNGGWAAEGDWETLRHEADGDDSSSFADATDQGDRQYVYRVRAHNGRGLLSNSHEDWLFTGEEQAEGAR